MEKAKSQKMESEARQDSRKRERELLKSELSIGARLRQMRIEHSLTQEQVAAMLGLNRTAYTHYENGLNMPNILTLVRLSEIYGLSPGELMQFLTVLHSVGESNKP